MCCVMISSHVRPGRPPKRVLPFPAPSPQDAMLQLNRSPLVTQDNFSRWVSIKLICVSNTDPSTSSGRLEVIPWMEDGSPGLLGAAPSPEVTPWPLGPPTWCPSITPLLCSGQVMCNVALCADPHDGLCRNAARYAWGPGGLTWSASPARGPGPRPPRDLQAAVRGLREAPPGVSHHCE